MNILKYSLVLVFILIYSAALTAQSATITKADGSTILLRYNSMVQTFAESGTGRTIVIYGPRYERYVSTQNYATFISEAKCNLIYFLDSNQGNRLMAIPPGSVDQVVKTGTKGRIFQQVSQATRLLTYDFAEPFDSIEARLDRCNIPAKTILGEDEIDDKITNSLDTVTFTTDTALLQTEIANALDTFSVSVTGAVFKLDTISQPLHSKTQYQAVYEIGGIWYQSFDNSPASRVDGIIIEVIDANTFVVQYDGYFNYDSHPYSVGTQQYVQPNGAYSTADTANQLHYGYALDDNTIQIGAKTTKVVDKIYVQDKIAWSETRPYLDGEVVNYDGVLYELTATSSRSQRPDTSSNWVKVTVREPAAYDEVYWDATYTYPPLSMVKYQGDLYKQISVSNSTGDIPTSSLLIWSRVTTLNPASISDVDAVTYFIPEDSLSTKSVNLNDRLIIKENGKQFYIKSDSVQYYPTDGVRVVNKGSGKYAVLDLSKKRVWESKSKFRQEVHFANLEDGEEIQIGEAIYEFYYSPIYYNYVIAGTSGQTNFAADSIPDDLGIFVDTVRLDAVKNGVLFSENIMSTFLTPIGIQPHNIDIPVLHNVDAGPRGNWKADAIIFQDAAAEVYSVEMNRYDFSPGDTVTFSFWYKGNDGAGVGERMNYTSLHFSGTGGSIIPSGPSTYDLILDGEWHEFTQSGTLGDGFRFFWQFQNFVANDTLYLSDFQLSSGLEVANYRKTYYDTRSDKDIAYLYRTDVLKNRTIDLRKFFGSDRTREVANAAQVINAAISYAAQGVRANRILLPGGMTLRCTEPIEMTRGVGLYGEYNAYRTFNSFAPIENIYTILKFDIQDTTRSGIEFIKTAGQTAIDNCDLQNFYITTTDSTQLLNLVYSEELNSSHIANITLTGDPSSYIKYSQWHFDVPPSSDSHYNTFEYMTFGSVAPNGFVYDGGSANTFTNIGSIADTAFLIKGGRFNAKEVSVEGANKGFVIDSPTAIVDVVGLYSEGAATNGGPVILHKDGLAKFTNARLQTISGDTLLKIEGGKYFEIDGGLELVYGTKFIEPGVNVVLKNMSTINPLYEELITANPDLKDWVKITGNNNTYEVFTEFKSNIPRNFQSSSVYNESQFDVGTITNITTLSSLRLEGKEENLARNSTDLFPATFEDTNFRLTLDSISGPNGLGFDGNIIADVITAKNNLSFELFNAGHNNISVFEPFDTGWYTISVYAKKLNLVSKIPRLVFQAPLLGNQEEMFLSHQDTLWHRYQITYYVENIGLGGVNIRVKNWQAGDIIALCHLQINTGRFALPYQATTTTGFRDTTVSTTIGGDGVWNVTGGLKLSTATNPYGGSDEIGQIVSDISGAIDSLKWQMYTVTTASTVTLSYPNNIISSTLNNGTFILDPSGFTGDNMIVKINSFATDDVTIDASGSYNFTINGVSQSTYDLLGSGAYAEFSFNSSLGTFELLNTSNAAGTIVDNTNLKVAMGADLQTYIQSADTAFLNARSTGPRYGGDLSDQGSGIVRIAAGSGGILDNTTPSDPDYYSLNWSQTDLDLSAVDDVYYIYVNNSGTVTSTTIAPSHGDYRTNIWLWRVSIRSGLVSGTTSIVQPVQQYGPQIWDVFKALGPTKSELVVEAASTNLTIAHTAGEVYIPGINFFNDPTNPHELEISATSPITFRHVDQDGDQGSDVTVLDVANYDNAGTITAIPGATTRAQIFTLKFFPGSNNYRFFYGQEWFDTVDDAYIALQDGTYAPTFPDAYNEAITLGWIIAQKGATNLADGTQLLITSNKFGAVGGAIVSVGIGDNDPANELQTMSLDSVTTAEGTTYTIDLTDGGGPFEFQNTVLSFQRTDPVSSSTTLTNSASDNLFVCTNAVASTQSHTVSTPSRDGTVMKVWTDASVSTTLTRSGGDLFLDTPGGSTSTTYVISGAGLAIFQYADGTWFKIN